MPMKINEIETHEPNDKRISPLKAPQSIIHIKHRISLRQYKYWVLLLQDLRHKFDNGIRPDDKGFYAMPMATLSELM